MYLELIFGTATLLSLGFAIYQSVKANKAEKDLEASQATLRDIEEGLVTPDLKLRKALEFYEAGHYKKSLSAFQAYARDSEDLTELKEAIRKIFREESRKIYSHVAGRQKWTPAMLVTTILSLDDETTAIYPDFVIEIMDIYARKSGSSLGYWRVPVYLNRQEYQAASQCVDELHVQKHSKKANEAFREFIRIYCRRMVQKEIEAEA